MLIFRARSLKKNLTSRIKKLTVLMVLHEKFHKFFVAIWLIVIKLCVKIYLRFSSVNGFVAKSNFLLYCLYTIFFHLRTTHV
jgi:hypothetical protein